MHFNFGHLSGGSQDLPPPVEFDIDYFFSNLLRILCLNMRWPSMNFDEASFLLLHLYSY